MPAGMALGQHSHAPISRERFPHPLANRQASFGYTSEEMMWCCGPWWTTGKEPVGAMGDDTPPAVMSKLPRLALSATSKQRFAEVTNPPIDPLREEMVMSPAHACWATGQLAGGEAGGHAADRTEVARAATASAAVR